MDFDFLCCCGGTPLFSVSNDNSDDNSGDKPSSGRRQNRGRSRTPRTNINACFGRQSSTSNKENVLYSFSSWWSPSANQLDMPGKRSEAGDVIQQEIHIMEGNDQTLSCTQCTCGIERGKSSSRRKMIGPSLERRDRSTSSLWHSSSSRNTNETLLDRRGIEPKEDRENNTNESAAEQSGLLRPSNFPPRSPRSRVGQQRKNGSAGSSVAGTHRVTRTPSWGALYQRMLRSRDTSVEEEPAGMSRISRVAPDRVISVDEDHDETFQESASLEKIGLSRNRGSFTRLKELRSKMRRKT